MGDDVGGEWAPIKQAATQLGVSVDTIRRRIQRGEVATRREETAQGYRWLVRIDPPKPTNPPSATSETDNSEHTRHNELVGPDPRDQLISALQAELDHRAREIAELHAILGSQAKAIEATAAMIVIPERVGTRPEEPAPGFWTRLKRVFAG